MLTRSYLEMDWGVVAENRHSHDGDYQNKQEQ
jgi:hypothetical protein